MKKNIALILLMGITFSSMKADNGDAGTVLLPTALGAGLGGAFGGGRGAAIGAGTGAAVGLMSLGAKRSAARRNDPLYRDNKIQEYENEIQRLEAEKSRTTSSRKTKKLDNKIERLQRKIDKLSY